MNVLASSGVAPVAQRTPPQSALQMAANLLDQQIWCFGRDIECTAGNLLVRFGCNRIPPPANISAPSAYGMAVSTTANVLLRGFGVFYGDQRWGGLFLRRFSFLPRFTTVASLAKPPWQSSDLPSLWPYCEQRFPQGRLLLIALIDWLRGYEAWIARDLGVAYRRATLEHWIDGKRTVVAAEEMAAGWRQVGTLIADHANWLLPIICQVGVSTESTSTVSVTPPSPACELPLTVPTRRLA